MAIVISGVNNNDKITATDGTIDLLSGVNYSSEVEVPSLKVGNNIQFGNAGIVTATSFAGNISGTTGTFGDFVNIGSNIQLGNAGVVTATTFTGNLTGNVNATSNLLFQIGGSEKVRIDSNGRLLVNTTTTYVSNQIMIVKGASPSGGNAPYDGQIAIEGSETNGAQDTGGVLAFIGHSGTGSRGFGSIRNLKEDGTSGNFGSYMSFHTRTNGSAPAEKLRITSDGKIGMKTTSPQKDLHVYNSSVATVRIETGDSRGQAWDFLSTYGAQNNTGTISIRDESGSSYIDFGANGGDPRLVAQLGGGSNLLYLDKHGNTNLAGICTATAFRGQIYPTIYAGGRRNMFINGEFSVIQRGNRDPHANQNNGANNLGYGGPDHVQVVKNIGSYEAKQVNENSSPRTQAGASYSYELDVTATGSTSNTGYCFLNWMWNGHEVNRLLYGTSSARPITVSFWCQSNLTGTFGLNMRNYGTDRMISQALTINSANTWEYKTVTFAGDTAAQFSVTINATMAIELWLAAGTDYNSGTPQSTWASRNNTRRSAGTNINIASNTSNYFRISLLQVEMGPYATPFEFRTYGEYLHDCEYYFQKPVSSRGSNYPFAIHTWGHKVADTYALRVQTMMRPTEMRINPTDYFHDNNPSGLTAQRFTIQGADYEYTYGVNMSIGSNRKEFANGNKYPYGVNGMGAGESGILWAYDFESYAEY